MLRISLEYPMDILRLKCRDILRTTEGYPRHLNQESFLMPRSLSARIFLIISKYSDTFNAYWEFEWNIICQNTLVRSHPARPKVSGLVAGQSRIQLKMPKQRISPSSESGPKSETEIQPCMKGPVYPSGFHFSEVGPQFDSD